MSQNDVIVLNANFETWQKRITGIKVDPWLYYCIEQFVKPFGLSDEEIQYGLTEGGNDGGADAIYFIANHGVLIQEDTSIEPKSVSRIRLLFMQVKRGGGFKITEIDKLVFLTDDFFDLSKNGSSLAKKYNPVVLKIMRTFKDKYLQVSGSFPDIIIDYYYITGDDVTTDANAIASGERVKTKAKAHLNKAVANFHFISAQALWEQVQKTTRSRENACVGGNSNEL